MTRDADAGGGAQLTSAALEGLGALIGGGRMEADARERAFATLLRHAAARDNEPYLLGVAEGLARSKDPRAVEWLDKLSGRRTSLDVRQAAQRGLAVGYRDEDAIKALRRELSGKDEELELRAAQVLYELADEEAFEWAVDVITQRRTADAGGADVRGQVVRDLVELGGEPSRQALRAALDDGSRNEWVEAWIAVGLLELGDETVVAASRSCADDRRLGSGPARRALDLARDQAVLGLRGEARDERRDVGDVVERAVAASHVVDRQCGAGRALAASVEARSARVVDGAVALAGRRCDREGATGRGVAHAAHAARGSDAGRAVVGGARARAQRRRGGAAAAGGRLRRRVDGRRRRVARSRAGAARHARALRHLISPAADATRALLAKAAADPDAGVRFIALAASAK